MYSFHLHILNPQVTHALPYSKGHWLYSSFINGGTGLFSGIISS
jgi:hypothetical protein